MRLRWWVIGLVVIAISGGAFILLGGSPGSGAAEAAYSVIGARDDFFQPEIRRVAVGVTVEWRNVGRNVHTVTADDGSFDSGLLQPGQEFKHTYEKPGIYTFLCTLHGTKGGGGMTGTVVVGDVPLTAEGGATGTGVGPGREPVPTGPGRTIHVPVDQPTI